MKPMILPFAGFLALSLHAAEISALTLAKTVPLADVRGRIDHFAMDAQGQRLFMAALGNDTVEVIDLKTGRRMHTIGNCSEPQGLGFVPAENRLVIANGGSGVMKILDAISFKVVRTIENLPNIDNVRYGAKSGLVYVGYGDGALAMIDPKKGETLAEIPLPGHPESFQLEQDGSRIFVNVPNAEQIAVIDREKKSVETTWPMKEYRANFPMALDEPNRRLFVGCRQPARLVVLDTTTGKPVADLAISGDTDDLFYDASLKRLYVSCGEGFVDIVDQTDANNYRLREKIPTRSGARTSFFCAERNELYVAVPGRAGQEAEIRIFNPQP